jgi:pilus assembly protein Flp/PilA
LSFRPDEGDEMERLVTFARRLARTDEGQDLVEYGLLMALIAVVAITAVSAVGQKVHSAFWELIANNI